AADVLPRVLRPRVVAELAGMRHRVKLPRELAGDDVVGANVAGRGEVGLAGGRAENDEVLEDLAGRIRHDPRDGLRIAHESFTNIDDAVGAEGADGLARGGVDLLEVVADAENDAAILAVLALPVVRAAPRHAEQPLVNPDLLARRRVERDERAVARLSVDHAARDDRVEERLAVRISPGDFELRDVALVDLLQGGEFRVVGAAAVIQPLAL